MISQTPPDAKKYIPKTGASISVISEEVAKAIGVEMKSYDKTRIKAVTADGMKVKDILGFTEVNEILGNQKLEKLKILFFKNATNRC